MHDHEHDDWYGYKVYEECIVKETFLEESWDAI